jgi:predicted permease
MWVPMMGSTPLGVTASMFSQRNAVWMVAIGRLAPNVGITQAQAELSAISTRLNQQYRAKDRTTRGIVVTPVTFFPANMRPVIGGFMMLLLAVAGLVLVIASTNVAGMMLARASVRRREIAVRLALGASRKQLVIQLVIESLLVFIAAAVAGLVVANWLVAGLMALVPKLPVQLLFDPQLDWRVLSFTLAMSLVTGVVAGLVPAMQSTRPDLVPALKSDGAGTATKQRMRLRSGLLVTQIAFSMLLLIVAGLFARTLSAARSIDPGFDPRGVYIASLNLDLANYDSTTGLRTVSTMLERVRSTPGVQSVATAAMLPLDGGGMGLGGIQVNGRRAPNGEPWDMDWNVVTPDYFATLAIPIVRGRAFSETERAGSDVAILNETFAAALFPGEDAVGRVVMNDDRPLTVVGIAKDAKYRTLGEAPRNFIYVPLSQRYMGRMHVLIKTAGAVPVATAMRRIMAEVDPALPILNQQSMVDQTRVSLFPQTLALYVSGGLGGVALLLALLGIYGVTAFSVSQRTREIGVRVALGAQRSHVLALVVRQGVVLAGIGVVVGSLAGFGATRLISSLLYGIAPTDLVAFGGAAALLAAAALVASWIPARRASRVDPVIALKSE